MKHIYTIGIALIFALFTLGSTTAHAEEKVDVKEVVLGHMSDAYEWHITTFGHKHVSFPLPVIVKSQRDGQWHVFSSARFEETAGGVYEGFYIDAARQGKIYEKGYNERPWDLSITKDVVQIWINVLVLLLIFIPCARWYKRHEVTKEAPKGFVGCIEVLVSAINDDVLMIFFFILVKNLMGLIPFFPGGANVTGNITITFLLAFLTFIAINVFGNKEYWKEVFWPDVPVWMKCPVPLMPVIEFFSLFTKPFALMVRLFANMLAGHAIILSLTCVIFITFQVNLYVGSAISVFSGLLMIFMNALELLVAFIQAYVFTMLSAIFIGLAHPHHEHTTN